MLIVLKLNFLYKNEPTQLIIFIQSKEPSSWFYRVSIPNQIKMKLIKGSVSYQIYKDYYFLFIVDNDVDGGATKKPWSDNAKVKRN